MLTTREICSILQSRGLAVQPGLSQNFLADPNVVKKMVRLSNFTLVDTVLEIGAGLGNLTELIAEDVRQIFAVEIDPAYCEFMRERFNAPMLDIEQLRRSGGSVQGLVVIVKGDFLQMDPSLIAEKERGLVVFGNLPYAETSPILLHLLHHRDTVDRILITVQKEVADRIVALPGAKNKAYGRLSVRLQTYFDAKILMRLGRTVFFPRPEVQSAFVQLVKKEAPFEGLTETIPEGFDGFLPQVIAQAFSKRRKMLRNVLPQRWPALETEQGERLFERIGIKPSQRAESLSINQFHQLALGLWRLENGE